MDSISLYVAEGDHDIWEIARQFSDQSQVPISQVVVAALRRYLTDDGRPTHLYWLYDRAGKLLYIGISGDVKNRLKQHAEKDWWVHVDPTRTRIERQASRATALLAEAAAIRSERPRFNRVFGKDKLGPRARQKPVRINMELWNLAQERIDQISSRPRGRRDTMEPAYEGQRIRNLRVSDELWAACQEKAKTQGMDMSTLVRAIIAGFVSIDLGRATAFLREREPWRMTNGHSDHLSINLSTVVRWGLIDYLSGTATLLPDCTGPV